MDKEDLLKKYFKQSLTEQEEKAFKGLLDTDADFKAQFEEYSNFNSAFKSREAAELKEFLKSIDEQPEIKKTVWYRSSAFYYAAAAILIIALCIPFLIRPSVNALYNDYFDTYPNVEQPIVRGSAENSTTKAFKAYENKNFDVASSRFKDLLSDNEHPNLKFYYAMSLVNDGKSDLALNTLAELENMEFAYKDETLWYSALILVKTDQIDRAISKLMALDKSGSSFKSKERKVLLSKLEDL